MTFFNKKEDVIGIELTPYGRSLLSKGKLEPVYYAFFDDDILYDSAAGGFTETNNLIEARIIDETPRVRPPRDLTSVEGSIFTYERSEDETRPHTRMKLNYMTEPMGTSDQTSDDAPSWKATFIQGEITGSVQTTLTGSDKYIRQIPQIESVIEYTMQIRNTSDDPPVRGQKVSPQRPVSQVFQDGTYVEVLEEQVLSQLREIAGFNFKDSLEVEVFLYDDTAEENLIPLKFTPRNDQIVDGILLDEVRATQVDIDPTYVEYYINFNTDGNIPSADICEGIKELKANDIQVNIEVDCPDMESVDFDIYGTRVTDVEICE
jgi:hypothetical protein